MGEVGKVGKVGKVRSCSPISPISLVPLVPLVPLISLVSKEVSLVPDAIQRMNDPALSGAATGLSEKLLLSPLHDFMEVVIGATLIG